MGEHRVFLMCLAASAVLNAGLWPVALEGLNRPGPSFPDAEPIQIDISVLPEPSPGFSASPLVELLPSAPPEATPPEPAPASSLIANRPDQEQDLLDLTEPPKAPRYVEVPPEAPADLPPIGEAEFIGVKPMRARDRLLSNEQINEMPRMESGRAPSYELQDVPFIAPLLSRPIDLSDLAEPSPAETPERQPPPSEASVAPTQQSIAAAPPESSPGATQPPQKTLARLPSESSPLSVVEIENIGEPIHAPTPAPSPATVESSPAAAVTPPAATPAIGAEARPSVAPHEAASERLPAPSSTPPPTFYGQIVMDRLPAPLRFDPTSNAVLYGDEAFNVKPHQYAPYYKHIRDQVGRYWFTMMASVYAQRGYLVKRVESVVVRFEVRSDGTLDNVRTIVGSEDPVFESICLRAIRSAPLRPFPKYITEPELKVVFNFMRPLY